jgi:hypothetical protein
MAITADKPKYINRIVPMLDVEPGDHVKLQGKPLEGAYWREVVSIDQHSKTDCRLYFDGDSFTHEYGHLLEILRPVR